MKKFIPAVLLSLALGACSSTEELASIGSDSNEAQDVRTLEPGYQCEKVKKRGSNVMEKVCTTRYERDTSEARIKAWNGDWLRARGQTTGRH